MTVRSGHPSSFEAWLIGQVHDVLGRRATPVPWMLWCDPRHEWRELLRKAASDGNFELWLCDTTPGEQGELRLRHRFATEEARPRVVWLPVARTDVGWFKVFALHAARVWDRSLVDALRDYGVAIRRSDEPALASLLAPHALEWFSEPKERWAELTPGNAKGALVDDERMFSALAGPEGAFAELAVDSRFEIFARRAVEDFGLPRPEPSDEGAWRVAALARLLATEAAEATPGNPPTVGDRIIPTGVRRDRALGLLRRWQTHISWVASLESLSAQADAQLGLTWWARNLSSPPRSRASRAVEQVLFDQAVERLERIEDVDALVRELERTATMILDRTKGFWSTTAQDKVPWEALGELAGVASALVEHQSIEVKWRHAMDAVSWYTGNGWRLDAEGERLFVESDRLPSAVQRIRARLRRAYLRAVDRIGRRFSELLADASDEVLALPSAGELALEEIERRKGPMALVFLDACRFDLGCRLAGALDQGEPQRRTEVKTAVAPLPSITALGMAFALPLPRTSLTVAFDTAARGFKVTADGFSGDLSHKSARNKWLETRLKAAELVSVNDVIEDAFEAASPRSKRLLVVHGAEFDTAGHEGELEIRGADESIERYARAIRRLRDKGYHRIVVVTDHGFFHWQPDDDEVEADKPAGTTRWTTRRAIVGTGLTHRTALLLPVSRSDLQVAVPRSVNAWRTYGGLGFFHGGAMLQEIIVPVITVTWPTKTTKVGVVLKPMVQITTRRPRVAVQAASEALLTAEGQVARRVVVKVQDPKGAVVFRHDPVLVESLNPQSGWTEIPIQLELVEKPPPGLRFGTELVAILRDADDDEELARENVLLKVEIDDWD